MRYIKKLPKNAKYDYTDIFGGKHYHSVTRKYTIYRGTIISQIKLKEDEIQSQNME